MITPKLSPIREMKTRGTPFSEQQEMVLRLVEEEKLIYVEVAARLGKLVPRGIFRRRERGLFEEIRGGRREGDISESRGLAPAQAVENFAQGGGSFSPDDEIDLLARVIVRGHGRVDASDDGENCGIVILREFQVFADEPGVRTVSGEPDNVVVLRFDPCEVGGAGIIFQAEIQDRNIVLQRSSAGDGFKLQRLQVKEPPCKSP